MTQMTATVQQWTESFADSKERFALLNALGSMADRFSSCAVSSAGMIPSSRATVRSRR